MCIWTLWGSGASDLPLSEKCPNHKGLIWTLRQHLFLLSPSWKKESGHYCNLWIAIACCLPSKLSPSGTWALLVWAVTGPTQVSWCSPLSGGVCAETPEKLEVKCKVSLELRPLQKITYEQGSDASTHLGKNCWRKWAFITPNLHKKLL